MRPHAVAHKYARDVVKGKVLACRWLRLACERHLADLRRRGVDFPYRFDAKRADRACRFIELLPHTKGKWAARGLRIKLEPWEVFFVCSVFGWLRKADGLRRFRKALLFVPRKNGKSILAAAIGLYMLAADGEFGAEIYSGATTEKQAWEVFRPARAMVERTPDFQAAFGVVPHASNIHIPANGSRFEPVIGKPGDGASPSCAIVDEYHEHDTDDLADTMETGMGAREQPLMLIVTTAGDNLAGPCYLLVLQAQKVLEGLIENDQLFAMLYTVDPEDDWTTEKALRKANPNYDVSVAGEFLQARQAEAIAVARKQGTFKTKHLNIWVGARAAYFNVQKWRECQVEDLSLADFAGTECVLGLDLASTVDLAALELVFPVEGGRIVRFGKYYLPETTVDAPENEHYRAWVNEGWITVTDGEMIDFNVIQEDIVDLSSTFQVREVAYDPHQATMLVTQLMGEGISCVEVRPTTANFSQPMKWMDGLIRAGREAHNGDPVMTWAISNVVARENAKDEVYPRKESREQKIDPVVAHLMALARLQVEEEDDAMRRLDEFLSNPVRVI